MMEQDRLRTQEDTFLYFEYGDTELNYLKKKDKILGAVIDQVGYVYREVDADLFSSVVHHIVGQQISTKAQATIWRRFSPYCSVASLYLWAVAGGAIPDMRDYAPKKKP